MRFASLLRNDDAAAAVVVVVEGEQARPPTGIAELVDEFLKHHGQFVVRQESRLLYP